MFNRKTVTKFAAAGLLACGLGGCPSQDEYGPKPDAFSILAVNSKTGSLSYLGPSLEKAMQFAVDDVNEAGGVRGRPLQLIAADDHSDEVAGLAEARFYYERYKDSVVGIAGSALDRVSKKLLSELANNDLKYGQKIPIVSPASAAPEFSELADPSNLFFRTVMSAENEGKVLAQKARDLGYKRGVVVAIRDNLGERLADTFKRTLGAYGLEYGADVVYYNSPSRDDVLAAFNKVSLAASPEFLLLISYGEDGKIALSEWSARFASLPLLLTSKVSSNPFFASLDQRTLSALDAVAVNGVAPGNDPESEGLKVFVARFCTRHPGECSCPPDKDACDLATEGRVAPFVPNAYDAVYVIALALEMTGHESPDSVRRDRTWNAGRLATNLLRTTGGTEPVLPGDWAKALEVIGKGLSIHYKGASAKALEFDYTGDVRSGYYVLWTVKRGAVHYTNSAGAPEAVSIAY